MTSAESAAKRERAIRLSLSGFVSSLFGLVPVLGLPFSIRGIACWLKIPRLAWNPAHRYGIAAAVLGFIGLVISLAVVFLVGQAIAEGLFD